MNRQLIHREITHEIIGAYYKVYNTLGYGFLEEEVLVEANASAALSAADDKQILNHLRASRLRVGLLLHFGPTPTQKRVVWTGKAFETEIDPAVSV